MLRTPLIVPALLAMLLLGGACGLMGQQRRGGLEGMTLDTPRQAFTYFREAARLKRYDLEYETFSPEFIERYGGFTLEDYLRGRPLVHGETKRLLDVLLTARVERVEPLGAKEVARARHVRLHLASEGYRGHVELIRKPFYRLGLRDLQQPLEGILDDLRRHVGVRENAILVVIPLSAEEVEIVLGGKMPEAEELTRVEVADRWYLYDVGEVFEAFKREDESSGTEDETP